MKLDNLQRLSVGDWAWPLVIIASTVSIDIMAFGDISAPIRPLLAIWFISICPGLALVRLLRLADVWSEVALSVALSMTMGVIVATGLLYAGWWSSKAILAILSVVSLGGAILQLYTTLLVDRARPNVPASVQPDSSS